MFISFDYLVFCYDKKYYILSASYDKMYEWNNSENLPTWQYLKIDMNIENLWYIKIKHSWKLNIYITHVNNVYDTLDVAITTAKLR